jgi:hypothetical protein
LGKKKRKKKLDFMVTAEENRLGHKKKMGQLGQ